MTRVRLALAGALLLAAAAFLAPPSTRAESALPALGRSLGALRVVLVDLIVLRADGLRRQGRIQEVAALYRTALDLDPDNAAAADLLAGVWAYDVLPEAPDDDARFGWWREAWDLLQRARTRHPEDLALALREADLLLDVAPRSRGLLDRVAGAVEDPRARGLDLLLEVARQTPETGRRGRGHLVRLAFLLPWTAALERAEGRPDWDRWLVAAEELLARRRADLAEMPYTLPAETSPGLDAFLEQSVEAVRVVGAGTPAAARDAAASYALAWPDAELAPLLVRLAEEKRR